MAGWPEKGFEVPDFTIRALGEAHGGCVGEEDLQGRVGGIKYAWPVGCWKMHNALCRTMEHNNPCFQFFANGSGEERHVLSRGGRAWRGDGISSSVPRGGCLEAMTRCGLAQILGVTEMEEGW